MNHFISQFSAEQRGEILSGRDFVNLSFGKELNRKSGEAKVEERVELGTREQLGPKPWINIKIEERWVDSLDNETKPRDYGILVHSLLENVTDRASLKKLKERVNIDPSLSEGEKHKLNESLNCILKDEDLSPYFSDGSVVYNEQGIWNGKEIRRPDRVVFEKEKWRILDYKTGKKEPKHRKQLEGYSGLLESSLNLGREVEKCLLYFGEDGKIESEIFI